MRAAGQKVRRQKLMRELHNRRCATRRPGWRWLLTAVVATIAALAASAVSAAPLHALAVGGTWHGTAEGIRVDDGHLQSGSPPDDVVSSSESNYQVELGFSFTVGSSGAITGTGHGDYSDAHWHLEGRNGTQGDFSCDPPIHDNSFPVVVGGQASGDQAKLSLAIPDSVETNSDYACGAGYSGYATTTHDMADSLSLVNGQQLKIALAKPTSLTLTKTVDSGGGDHTEHDQIIWSFSVTPPSGGSGNGSGTGGSSGSCPLSLTRVAAKPAHARAGQPMAVSFHVTAAAHARLFVAKPGGTASTVDSRQVAAGTNALAWSGWIGPLPAKAGSYKLTVEASACGTTKKSSLTVTTT